MEFYVLEGGGGWTVQRILAAQPPTFLANNTTMDGDIGVISAPFTKYPEFPIIDISLSSLS